MSSRQADALHGVPKRKGPRWKENTKGPKSLRSDGPRSMVSLAESHRLIRDLALRRKS
jgi:hypothetical protein